MNESSGQFDELGQLAAALCDGEITPEQAARLEELATASDDARQFFHQYVLLHGELYWEHAAGSAPPPLAQGWFRTRLRRHKRLACVAAAAGLVAALVAIPLYRAWTSAASPRQPLEVARVGETMNAQWSEGEGPDEEGRLMANNRLVLCKGLAEIVFQCGATVILQGPAAFEPQSSTGGLLSEGRLTARVPPEVAGFVVRTPLVSVVDRGTEFGVGVARDGRTEVAVFSDSVDVRPNDGSPEHEVRAGDALRIASAAGGPRQVERLAAGDLHFVRSLAAAAPQPGSVARLRTLVAASGGLIHHYTFEGASPEEKRRDRRGNLDLAEAVMRDGNGGGKIDYSAVGLDATSEAIRPFRPASQGNARGVALQSKTAFRPPKALTVELLLNLAGVEGDQDGMIAAAVATRQGPRDCSFFIAAMDRGELVEMMDGQAPWLESGFLLAPGHWYYVASTYRVDGDRTIVNCYMADLTAGQRTLSRVLADKSTPGVPTASLLGIGKGFDGETAHAYPWWGMLDEIAIYDTALDAGALQAHFEAVAGQAPAKAGGDVDD